MMPYRPLNYSAPRFGGRYNGKPGVPGHSLAITTPPHYKNIAPPSSGKPARTPYYVSPPASRPPTVGAAKSPTGGGLTMPNLVFPTLPGPKVPAIASSSSGGGSSGGGVTVPAVGSGLFSGGNPAWTGGVTGFLAKLIADLAALFQG